MFRHACLVIAVLQLVGCGGGLPPQAAKTGGVVAPAAGRSIGSAPFGQSPVAVPTISLAGEKFCVTGASYATEHQGRTYPTIETSCDYSQQRVVIDCPGGCMAAQRVRYAIQALPSGVMYSPCSNKQPSFEPGNYNVDTRSGSYFIYLSGYSSRHYDTANPGVCKDFGQTLLLGFLVKRVSDGATTPLRIELTMLP